MHPLQYQAGTNGGQCKEEEGHHCSRAAVAVRDDPCTPCCRVKPAVGDDVPAGAQPNQRDEAKCYAPERYPYSVWRDVVGKTIQGCSPEAMRSVSRSQNTIPWPRVGTATWSGRRARAKLLHDSEGLSQRLEPMLTAAIDPKQTYTTVMMKADRRTLPPEICDSLLCPPHAPTTADEVENLLNPSRSCRVAPRAAAAPTARPHPSVPLPKRL